MHVLLYNRNLTSVCAPQLVTGSNGQIIGTSKFDQSRSFHTLELNLEAYEVNARAISETSHLAMRKWEPHFVMDVVVEEPAQVVPVAPFVAGLSAPTPEAPQYIPTPEPEPRHPDTYSPPPDEHADLKVPYFSLQKIARKESVDISDCDGMPSIRAAIIKAREAKLQPA